LLNNWGASASPSFLFEKISQLYYTVSIKEDRLPSYLSYLKCVFDFNPNHDPDTGEFTEALGVANKINTWLKDNGYKTKGSFGQSSYLKVYLPSRDKAGNKIMTWAEIRISNHNKKPDNVKQEIHINYKDFNQESFERQFENVRKTLAENEANIAKQMFRNQIREKLKGTNDAVI